VKNIPNVGAAGDRLSLAANTKWIDTSKSKKAFEPQSTQRKRIPVAGATSERLSLAANIKWIDASNKINGVTD
jgi:hypothetical protein